MWEKLLMFLGMRQQARLGGLSSKEANKAAAEAVAMQELMKKAEQEAAKKQQ